MEWWWDSFEIGGRTAFWIPLRETLAAKHNGHNQAHIWVRRRNKIRMVKGLSLTGSKNVIFICGVGCGRKRAYIETQLLVEWNAGKLNVRKQSRLWWIITAEWPLFIKQTAPSLANPNVMNHLWSMIPHILLCRWRGHFAKIDGFLSSYYYKNA